MEQPTATPGRGREPGTKTLRERLRGRDFRRKLFAWGMLAPILLWFLIYMFVPILMVVGYSFTNAHMAYRTFKFVGLAQYVKVFTNDPIVPIALLNTIRAVVYIMPVTVVLATLSAAAMNLQKNRWREFFTFSFFLPSVISAVAIALIWNWLYHPNFGLLNALMKAAGLPPQPFLTSSGQALQAISVIEVWSIVGYYSVVILAAIRGIDLSLYEAARIDGASEASQLRHVTLPMIRPALLFVGVMSTIASFMVFTPVKVLTDGTPGTSTMVLMLLIMNNGIKNSNIGYASALSLVLLVLILIVSFAQWAASREPGPGAKIRKTGRKSK